MGSDTIPVVQVQMLIRKPAGKVFQSFIDPSITTNFWFTKSSGRLEVGRTVTWSWEMYGVAGEVHVIEIIPNKKISVVWGVQKTTVDFIFTAVGDDNTLVVIKNYGFRQGGDDLIQAIKDNTGGFTSVLAGLKAYLEHGINLNLIADENPAEIRNLKV
jgi:uncharacterized protein YndB with AHSA1/START domain